MIDAISVQLPALDCDLAVGGVDGLAYLTARNATGRTGTRWVLLKGLAWCGRLALLAAVLKGKEPASAAIKGPDIRGMRRGSSALNGRYDCELRLLVRAVDLSENGCQFIETTGWLTPRQAVTVRVGSIGPIEGTIRWVDGRKAGIEFQRPIYGPTFEDLRATLDRAKERAERRSGPRRPRRVSRDIGSPGSALG